MKTEKYRKTAVKAALKAGEFILKSLGRIKSIRYKSEINVVTDIDRKAEDIIVSAIKKSFPEHNFLAEEKKYKKKISDFTWIIDPLDGTTNFLHGFPIFCTSIGLYHKGNMLAGAVYDPTRGELFHSEKGKGAFLNQKRIRVSKVQELKKALLCTGFAYNVKNARNNNINYFTRYLKTSQAVRRCGSAAIDLCYVAAGRFDGFWELYLNPWDTAAGLLMVKEAGGRVTKFDGSPYTAFDRELLASNSKIHKSMIKVLT